MLDENGVFINADNKQGKVGSFSAILQDNLEFERWLEEIDLEINESYILAGSCFSKEYPSWPRDHDNFHFPLGMKKLLHLGFVGIRDAAKRNSEKVVGNQRQYLLLISQVYDGIINTVERFAEAAGEKNRIKLQEICFALTQRAPVNFEEACQLYWFVTIFRIKTSTIGRIDQHLISFFDESNVEHINLVAELLKRWEVRGDGKGDTLQNITLGGRDANGTDKSNSLTELIMRLCIDNKYIEPKVNFRVHRNTPGHLLALAAEYQLTGTGLCTIYNDETIIDGLMSYGRPSEIAQDFCADGCTEVILDGHGETVFRYIDCVKAVEHTLFNGSENKAMSRSMQYYTRHTEKVQIQPPVARGAETGTFESFDTYQAFHKAYLIQLQYQIKTVMAVPYNEKDFPMRLMTAATLPGVLETGIEPYSNEACYHTYGLFIGSLGTAANCLAAVKKLVYEDKSLTKSELMQALTDDFKGHESIQSMCRNAPKFGNDDDYVDQIAVEVADLFAGWVSSHTDSMGKPIVPGLYNHLFHHTAYYVGATPDGRIRGESVGEHFSPSPGTAKQGPTAVINSVCKVNTSKHVFGSTLHLNLSRMCFVGVEDTEVMKQLNNVFLAQGGCVINTSVLDWKVLREARSYPEQYADLVVRVWGFSYYFTQMSEEMQDHIISRAKLI